MVIDSSAIVAILRQEAESSAFIAILEAAVAPKISAATYVEAGIVIDGARDAIASRKLDELIAAAAIEILPFTPAQARIAREAYRDFGKGSGHAARLNYGDCIAYALAKDRGEPLLFKGTDFAHTDVKRAV